MINDLERKNTKCLQDRESRVWVLRRGVSCITAKKSNWNSGSGLVIKGQYPSHEYLKYPTYPLVYTTLISFLIPLEVRLLYHKSITIT